MTPIPYTPSGAVWDFIVENISIVYGLFKNISLSRPLGVDISLWTLFLSLFVCGTIINLLTGSSDDLDE